MISAAYLTIAVLLLISFSSSGVTNVTISNKSLQVNTTMLRINYTSEVDSPTTQPENPRKKDYKDGSPMIQPHRKKHHTDDSPVIQPPLERHVKKGDSKSKMRWNLGLGIGLGLGIPILSGILYTFYYIYTAAAAHHTEQELQTVQQTLARRAFVESFPVPPTEEGTVYSCPICLDDFVEGSNLRLLPSCDHLFCIDCIDTAWADVSRPAQCPLCRHQYDMWQTDSGALE